MAKKVESKNTAFIKAELDERKAAKATEKVAEKKEEPKVKESPKLNVSEKLGDPSTIIRTYDLLIKQLSDMEVQQRQKNKPYRIYFVHRHRVEVMRLNFIKSIQR